MPGGKRGRRGPSRSSPSHARLPTRRDPASPSRRRATPSAPAGVPDTTTATSLQSRHPAFPVCWVSLLARSQTSPARKAGRSRASYWPSTTSSPDPEGRLPSTAARSPPSRGMTESVASGPRTARASYWRWCEAFGQASSGCTAHSCFGLHRGRDCCLRRRTAGRHCGATPRWPAGVAVPRPRSLEGCSASPLHGARVALGSGAQHSLDDSHRPARPRHLRPGSPRVADSRRLPAARPHGRRRCGPRALRLRGAAATGSGGRLLPADLQQRRQPRPRPLDRRRRARRHRSEQRVRSSYVGRPGSHAPSRRAPLRALDDHVLPLPAVSLGRPVRRP
jgi:hypothetical protein